MSIEARKLGRVHVALAVVWVLLLAPTLLWWPDSVLFVAAASIYANVWLHIDGYGAARAEEKAEGD